MTDDSVVFFGWASFTSLSKHGLKR